jgi:hypothetical protein
MPDQSGRKCWSQLFVFVCNTHELWCRNDLWSRRLLCESVLPPTLHKLTRRVIIIPPKLPHLDLQSVNREKQQRAKQLLDSHSARTAGQLVQYQVEMKGLTRYIYLSHYSLEVADELVYRCFQRARVLRRMHVRTILCCECHRWARVSRAIDRLYHVLILQLFDDAECHKRRIHLR